MTLFEHEVLKTLFSLTEEFPSVSIKDRGKPAKDLEISLEKEISFEIYKNMAKHIMKK